MGVSVFMLFLQSISVGRKREGERGRKVVL